jgi:protein gp37
LNVTNIEWCQRNDGTSGFSANPLKYRRKSDGKVVWSCVKMSAGCKNCYSETIALRYHRGKLFNAANMEELEPFMDDAELRKMLNAKTVGGVQVSGSRCFVGDMSDLFGAWVPDTLLDRLFAVFAMRADVTWMVLTKRAERIRDYLASAGDSATQDRWEQAAAEIAQSPCAVGIVDERRFPLSNVWCGVSAEDQKNCDERIAFLLQVPAAVRFVSFEPLLGAIKVPEGFFCGRCAPMLGTSPHATLGPKGISWAILGGESGNGARPFRLDHAVQLKRQCVRAGIATFFKQMGGNVLVPYYESDGHELRDWALDFRDEVLWPGGEVHSEHDGQPPPGSMIRVKLKSKKGNDLSEWPEELRLRQFPREAVLA